MTEANKSQLARFFRPGERVPESGIYRVFHGGHRVAHEVTLLRDEVFPECKQCLSIVHFELVRSAPGIERRDFNVRLYQLPHPDDDEADEKAAAAGG